MGAGQVLYLFLHKFGVDIENHNRIKKSKSVNTHKHENVYGKLCSLNI